MKKFIFLLNMLLVVNFPFAQVGIGTTEPNPTSALHVTNAGTPNKGVLLAPMTKIDRDAIISPTNGLIIYNTTENCLNYFNDSKWRSLCGEVQQAIAEANIGEASLNGTYIVGKPTTGEEYIILPVNVTEEGSINISITTGNGYSFAYSNPLISAGAHEIKLPASGTPAKEQVDQGIVTLNGKENTTITIPITVGPNIIPKKLIVSCPPTVNGSYIQGQALTGGNTITVSVNSTTNDEVA